MANSFAFSFLSAVADPSVLLNGGTLSNAELRQDSGIRSLASGPRHLRGIYPSGSSSACEWLLGIVKRKLSPACSVLVFCARLDVQT